MNKTNAKIINYFLMFCVAACGAALTIINFKLASETADVESAIHAFKGIFTVVICFLLIASARYMSKGGLMYTVIPLSVFVLLFLSMFIGAMTNNSLLSKHIYNPQYETSFTSMIFSYMLLVSSGLYILIQPAGGKRKK